MKSDLSKFRMPKNTPLESKERVNVNKNLNKTPLSSMVESAPKIPRSQTTTNKEGVNPQKVNQTEKFKGETTPSKMNNSEQFLGETTPTPSNKESKFLGETNPSKMDNSETFLGETTPKPANNSEQFLGETTPTKSNLQEKFLGETNPNKFDNSEKFLGETTPKSANNSEQFLGETDAKPMSLEERFLGETTPSKMNNSEQFLGETTPTPSNKESKFLGETNTKPMSLEERFLGETTPNPSDRSSKFLGETTPTPANNESRFLGETTPNPSDRSSKFLGETTPNPSDRSSKFLGETTPNPSDRSSKFLGETTNANITQGDKDKGETTPRDFTFNPNHSDRGVTPTDVNYIQDIHATGFNSKFGGVDATKFIGVNPNNTVFDNTNSLYSNIDDGKFTLGKTYEQSFDSVGRLNSGETGFGIGKGQAKRQSPSFLDLQYNKFNLRDDAFNLGTAAFAHPLILRGIQRKGLSKKEPQNWGLGIGHIDDGLVRGGIVTAAERSVIDAVRLGKWMISVNGLLWGIKQLGLQASNSNVETVTGKRLTKVWTPVNTIASAVGNAFGLHPRRHGLLPLPEKVGPEKYESVQKIKRVGHTLGQIPLTSMIGGNRLAGLWGDSFLTAGSVSTSITFKGTPFLRLQGMGGPNSLYGLIPGGKIPTRNEDTRYDIFYGNTILNQYGQYYSGNAPLSTKTNDVLGLKKTVGDTLDLDKNFRDKSELAKKYKDKKEDYTNFKPERNPADDPNEGTNDITGNNAAGAIYSNEYTYEENREDLEGNDLAITRDVIADDTDGIKVNLNTTETHTSYGNPFNNGLSKLDANGDSEGKVPGSEVIKDYQTMAYGDIPDRVAGNTVNTYDFRSKLSGQELKRAEKEDYNAKNINKRVNFGNPGKLGESEDRVDWTNTDIDGDRYDKITALDLDESGNDLVNMWFQAEGLKKVQFRGTAKGITETFSPSWDSVKYNGRADQAYKYTTFERSLSFNFQAYATSRIEMKPMWKKLEYLSTMTMPQYGGGNGYQGTLVKFRLGDLYNKKLAFIESLSYTMSDETPWDLNIDGNLGELPMGVDISIGLKILGEVRPAQGVTGIYDWSFA